MRRIRLTVAYDGTNYRGWQLQPNGVSIEEVLNKALSELLKEPVCVTGASRTDSGVHALGNIAVFDTESRIPGDKICYAVNQRLPEDIRVLCSEEVPLTWHPRKQNCVKTYEYKILNCRIQVPTRRLYAHFYYYPLDVEKMQEAAGYLLGEHDFVSFCSAGHQAEETVRTLYSVTVEKDADEIITIRLRGSGFLYNMVRIIAGTLIKVGSGAFPPEHMREILEARDRKEAGETAPARGLTLIGIEYEKEPERVICGENGHWKYELDQSGLFAEEAASGNWSDSGSGAARGSGGSFGPGRLGRPEAADGVSVLTVYRCEPNEIERLVRRMVHQAYRNGAEKVFVRAAKNLGLSEEVQYGLYRLRHAGEETGERQGGAVREDAASPGETGTALWEAIYTGRQA